METLPNEIISNIILYLDPKDIMAVSKCSHKTKNIVDQVSWKELAKRVCPNVSDSLHEKIKLKYYLRFLLCNYDRYSCKSDLDWLIQSLYATNNTHLLCKTIVMVNYYLDSYTHEINSFTFPEIVSLFTLYLPKQLCHLTKSKDILIQLLNILVKFMRVLNDKSFYGTGRADWLASLLDAPSVTIRILVLEIIYLSIKPENSPDFVIFNNLDICLSKLIRSNEDFNVHNYALCLLEKFSTYSIDEYITQEICNSLYYCLINKPESFTYRTIHAFEKLSRKIPFAAFIDKLRAFDKLFDLFLKATDKNFVITSISLIINMLTYNHNLTNFIAKKGIIPKLNRLLKDFPKEEYIQYNCIKIYSMVCENSFYAEAVVASGLIKLVSVACTNFPEHFEVFNQFNYFLKGIQYKLKSLEENNHNNNNDIFNKFSNFLSSLK